MPVSNANETSSIPSPAIESASTSPSDDIATLIREVREFRATIEKHDAKISDLGRGLGKLRERTRAPMTSGDDAGVESTTQPSQPGAPALTQEDLDATWRLGELSARLPENARARLKGLREKGHSILVLAELAETMIETSAAPATGNASQNSSSDGTRGAVAPPPGAAATSAPRTSPSHPRSLAEFRKLKQSDPKRFEALMQDPTFAPDELPNVLR